MKVHPSKGRLEAELKEVDSQDPLQTVGYDLAKLRSTAPAATGGAFGGLAAAAAAAAGAAAAAAAADEPYEGSDDDEDEHSDSGSGVDEDSPGPPPGPPCFHCLQVRLSNDSDAEEGDYGANDDEMLEEETSAPHDLCGRFVKLMYKPASPLVLNQTHSL